ncbi:oxidoreductase domain-containing protein [Decorospora gaudefroyi]|uniref:Oxidoreductase domain-containing protein n=1 Tax=Decorospora gaudefroyi TaxID=184978 RepID=A0A6A5K1Y8_9PLEO|nr:oxidoreductase domain-containing protein [Decorospora gaudefroyi]
MASTTRPSSGFQDDLLSAHERQTPVEHTPTPSTFTLPDGFLGGPAPNLVKSKINFAKGGIPEHADAWAVVLDGVVSEEECSALVKAAEATTNGEWERAMVNVGGGRQALYEDTRKCGRIIWDNREIMTRLWARIEASVPEIHTLRNWANVTGNGPAKRAETWKVTRLNERARCLKYTGGEYFKAHCDGTYETPDCSERSYFTLHLYLNDAEGKNGERQLEGGATTFFNWGMTQRIDVVPKCGRVLLFQHRGLLHAGDDVISGTKLTLRTDIMYALEDDNMAAEPEA